MKSNILSLLKFFLGWPLSFVALFFIFRFFAPHFSEIQAHLFQLHWFYIFFSVLSFFLYFLFRVLLWGKILQMKGHTVPFIETAWYWSLAELNRYVPGNIWSIVSRSTVFGKFGVTPKQALLAWASESILVLLGSLAITLLGTTLLFFHMLPPFPLRQILYISANTLICTVLVSWVFQKYILRFVHKKLTVFTFAPYQAFLLLLISSSAFFFFGLGTYFAILSLSYLPLQQVLEFVGLFSASFLLGYLSLIMPMGLGIRELVITDGLLGFISQTLVGFASIFARIILILSELLFLVVAYCLVKSNFSKRVEWLKEYITELFLATGIVVYSTYFTAASFLRYTNFYTGRFDLGNMDQTVWNTFHGRIFQLTDPNGTNIMSRLGTHADFILILLAPFYFIWRDPRMLLLLQTLILATGALFVYLIAKRVLQHKTLSLILAGVYLLNPSVQYTNLYDFHAVTFATTFFLGAWYFLQKKKYFFTLLFLLLAGLTKEEAWIVIGFFGIYIALFHKKYFLGILTAIISFVTCYLLIWKFIPLARGGQHFALGYYADFGSTPTSIIKNILFSPTKVLALLFEKSRFVYYSQLLLPVGFLAIVTPYVLLFALPDLTINLLSNNIAFRQIYYQYSSVITPFLFIATIESIKQIQTKWHKVQPIFFVWYLIFFAIVSAYFFGPLPGTRHPNIDMFTKQPTDTKLIENFLNNIPRQYSVAATNNLGSHLTHRQEIFTIPVGIDKADIIVFLLNDPFAQPSLKAQKDMAKQLEKDPTYTFVFAENDFLVFEKKGIHIEKP